MGSQGPRRGFNAFRSSTTNTIREAIYTGKATKKIFGQALFGGSIGSYLDLAPFHTYGRPVHRWEQQKTFEDMYNTGILGPHEGDPHKLGKAMELDPGGTAAEIMRQYLAFNSDMEYDRVKEGDPKFEEYVQNYSASLFGQHHLYANSGYIPLRNAGGALKEPNYTFDDVTSIPNALGILDENDPADRAIMEEYDNCKSSGERKKLLIKREPYLTDRLRKQAESGQPLRTGQHLMLSQNRVRVGAEFTTTMKDKQGKDITVRVVVLQTTDTHSFHDFAIHAAIEVGPNVCRWVTIGGGMSNAPFLDHINSRLAPPMWALVKGAGAARREFKRMQTSGEVPKDVAFDEWFFENHKDLAYGLSSLRVLMGAGELLLIWMNQFFGKYSYQAPTLDEYVSMTEMRKDAQGRIDIDSIISYDVIGTVDTDHPFNNPPKEEKVLRTEADDGLKYKGETIDFRKDSLPRTLESSTIAKDGDAMDTVAQLTAERIADVLNPLRAQKREEARKMAEEFFKTYERPPGGDISTTVEDLGGYSHIVDAFIAALEGTYEDIIGPQLQDDINNKLKESNKDFSTDEIGLVTKNCFEWIGEHQYTHGHGAFLFSTLSLEAGKFLVGATPASVAELQKARDQKQAESKALEQKINDAIKVESETKTAEAKVEVDNLKAQREATEEEIKQKQSEIEREGEVLNEGKDTAEHAGKDIGSHDGGEHHK